MEEKRRAIEQIKYFFKSSMFQEGKWILCYLIEYLYFTHITKIHIVTTEVRVAAVFSMAACLLLLVIWGIKNRNNGVEKIAYFFVIGIITLNKVNTKEVFEGTFHKPFWAFYACLIGYVILRAFLPFNRIGERLDSLFYGFKEARYEEMNQRYQKQLQDREKKEIRRANEEKYHKIREQVKNGREKVTREKERESSDNDCFEANQNPDTPDGIDKKEKNYSQKNAENDRKKTEKKWNTWLNLSIVVFCFIFPVLFILLYMFLQYNQNNDSDNYVSLVLRKIIGGNNIERIWSLLSFIIVIAAMYLILLILFFVIWVVFAQIFKSAHTIYNDLKKSIINPNEKNKTSMIFYAFIIFVVGAWFNKNTNIKVGNIGEQMISADIIVLPIIIAIFIPIIALLMDFIDKGNLETLMKTERAKEIKELLIDLVFGTLFSVLHYLKLITSDYLNSIRELSNSNMIDSDEEQCENAGDKTIKRKEDENCEEKNRKR